MLSCPDEVLVMIAERAAHRDLQNHRGVCRRLERAGSEAVLNLAKNGYDRSYDTICISLDERTMQTARAIADQDILRRAVMCVAIKIRPLDLTELDESGMNLIIMRLNTSTHIPANRVQDITSTHRIITGSEIHIWEQYTVAVAQQRIYAAYLSRNNCAALTSSFEKIPSIKFLALSHPRLIDILDDPYIVALTSGSEIAIRGHSRHYDLFFIACSALAHLPHLNVVASGIGPHFLTTYIPGRDTLFRTTRHITRLILAFRHLTEDCPGYWHPPVDRNAWCRFWREGIQGLQDLTVCSQDITPHADCRGQVLGGFMLETITSSSLRQFRLGKFAVGGPTLLNMLTRHAGTLRYLEVDDVVINEWFWHSFLASRAAFGGL